MTVLLFQSSFVQNRENKLTSHVSLIAPGALAIPAALAILAYRSTFT
jgi:hypothetical protein